MEIFHFLEILPALCRERLRIFFIQVSLKTFWHPYTWILKHMGMRKSQLLVTTYYVTMLLHTSQLLVTGAKFFTNEFGQRFYQLVHVTFSKNVFCSVNCILFFTIFITSKLQLYRLYISIKKLDNRNHIQEKPCDHIWGAIYRPNLWRVTSM